MDNLEVNNKGQFEVKFGNDLIKVKANNKFKELCTFCSSGYKAGAVKELIRIASLYKYYNAIGNDVKAGNILTTNRADHVEDMLKIAKGLMELDDFKTAYNKVRKQHEQVRIERGKQNLLNMLDTR